MDIETEFRKLVARVEKLERATFTLNEKPKNDSAKGYSGATGGIRLLASKGHFEKKREFAEITTELEKQGYNYSRQAVQIALTRLSKIGGPLVKLDIKGRKIYAKRK